MCVSVIDLLPAICVLTKLGFLEISANKGLTSLDRKELIVLFQLPQTKADRQQKHLDTEHLKLHLVRFFFDSWLTYLRVLGVHSAKNNMTF